MKIDRLVNIIQPIQLARKTGLLVVVRRGHGVLPEEGSITFVNGKVTDAQVGRHKGTDAYNMLSLWEECIVMFTSSDSKDDDLSLLLTEKDPETLPNGHTKPPFVAISPLRRSTSFPSQPQEVFPAEEGPSSSSVFAIPSRAQSLNYALALIDRRGFPRTYRQVFLLINEQRSILDLVRLTRRTADEISSIVQDLEQAGIIRIERGPPGGQ